MGDLSQAVKIDKLDPSTTINNQAVADEGPEYLGNVLAARQNNRRQFIMCDQNIRFCAIGSPGIGL